MFMGRFVDGNIDIEKEYIIQQTPTDILVEHSQRKIFSEFNRDLCTSELLRRETSSVSSSDLSDSVGKESPFFRSKFLGLLGAAIIVLVILLKIKSSLFG